MASRTSGMASQSLPDLVRASRPLPNLLEGFPTTPDHTRTYVRASRPLPEQREGIPSTPGPPKVPPIHSLTS